MTMKVLFATDGSDLALQAQSLIASIPWPADTSILVLHVIPLSGVFGPSTAAHGHLRRAVDHELETTRQALAGPGRQVDSVVKVGRPASTIVDDAREIEADLVVLGSRGHGAVVSALLGSVAAEVVDYAPCPVLVARSDRLTGVVLAHDGSPGASQAEAVLPAISGDLYDALVRDARTYAEGVAVDAAARLKSAGLTAVAQVAEGSAADAISRSAGTTDLIAMGTRGQTGLARLLLGSVARSILHRANSSVLFVPQAAARP
jgi:nucleotide-binding universal stress UspA family protein